MQIFDLFSDLHQARMRGRGKGNWGKRREDEEGIRGWFVEVRESQGEERMRERLNGKPLRAVTSSQTTLTAYSAA